MDTTGYPKVDAYVRAREAEERAGRWGWTPAASAWDSARRRDAMCGQGVELAPLRLAPGLTGRRMTIAGKAVVS